MSDRDQLRQALADAIAADLESKGFMGWFANANSSLWAERTPEQEIGRVSAYALLPVVDAHVQAERERIAAAIEANQQPGTDKYDLGRSVGLVLAARIVRGGAS